MAILSLGKEACLDFWGSLDDARADCAAVAAAIADGADTGDGDDDADSTDGAASSSGVAGGSTDRCEDRDSGKITTTATSDDVDDADGQACQSQRQVQKKKNEARRKRALASVWCEDCSLVVFGGKVYYDAWHGIASTADNSGSSSSSSAETAAAAAAAAPPSPPPPSPAVALPSAQVAAPSLSGGVGGGRRGGGGEEGTVQKRLSFTIRRVARVIPADSVMEHSEARSEMERRRRGFERSVTETGVTVGAHTAAAAAAAAVKG